MSIRTHRMKFVSTVDVGSFNLLAVETTPKEDTGGGTNAAIDE